ncbi:hypothetical protein ACWEQ1_04665 [Streptomyces nodosus]
MDGHQHGTPYRAPPGQRARRLRLPAAGRGLRSPSNGITGVTEEYCRIHELQLSGVFRDRRATTEPSSTAFTGLLDALALPDVYGVIAPALSHLGPKHLAAERTRRIEATGARLLLARRPRIGPVHVPRHQIAHRRFPAPLRPLSTES